MQIETTVFFAHLAQKRTGIAAEGTVLSAKNVDIQAWLSGERGSGGTRPEQEDDCECDGAFRGSVARGCFALFACLEGP